MTHSTVLVIVDEAHSVDEAISKAEELLAPFNENLPEGDAYKVYIEGRPEEWYMTSALIDGGRLEVDRQIGELSWDEVITAANGLNDGMYGVDDLGPFQWSTYNQRSRWDWYVLGGRWRGFLPLKRSVSAVAGRLGKAGALDNEPRHPGQVDVCQKKDIDVLQAQRNERDAANALYDRFQAVLDSVSEEDLKSYLAWPAVLEMHELAEHKPGERIEEARNYYHSQPLKRAMVEAQFWGSPEEFGWPYESREEYVDKQVSKTLITHAVLTSDGVWHEHGEMGWWGIESAEKPDEVWEVEFNQLWKDVKDDAWMLVYDVHI